MSNIDNKILDYINNYTSVFMPLYNFEYINVPLLDENIVVRSDLFLSLQKESLKYKESLNNFYYLGKTFNNEESTYLALTMNNHGSKESLIELITLNYRYLNGLGISNITVKLNNNLTDITSILEVLDIKYTFEDIDEDYLIICENKEFNINKVLCTSTKIDNSYGSLVDIDSLINLIKEYSCYIPTKELDVYIVNKTNNLLAYQIIDDLRLSEFSVYSLDDDSKVNELNPKVVITLTNEDTNYITLTDNLTKETTKVLLSDLIDYLNANI